MLMVPDRNLAQAKRSFAFKVYPVDNVLPVRDSSLLLYNPPSNRELMEALVGLTGGPMHRLGILMQGEQIDMFVDDLAMIVRDRSARNERATSLYRHHHMSKSPLSDPERLPFICGDAIIFDECVWE